VVDKASEVLKELNDMRNRVQELMRDEEFMSYVESKFVKADEEVVKKEILEASSLLKYALAFYRLNNNELDEAKELFNEVTEKDKEIGDYENYLVNRSWALRVETIEGSLVGEKLVNEFRQLYEETFNVEHFELTAPYLSIASSILGNYLVSLALISDIEGIRKLPEKHWWVLYADWRTSVLTRFMLNALLGSRGGLSNELDGKLSVSPEELINAFESDIHSRSLPALRVAFNKISPEDGIKLCEEFNDEVCKVLVLAVKGDSAVVKQMREAITNAFNNSLKGFGSDVESLNTEFEKLVDGLDGRSLVQLVAPSISMAQFALILHALINGNKELAKAHALYGALRVAEKLLTMFFLEAYRACCDLSSESFRHALARLFFLHV
jgi:tetratricopeptide (TPR) repeat protein